MLSTLFPRRAGLLAGLALLLAGPAGAATEARVFPVAGVFWNHQTEAINQRFMAAQDLSRLTAQVQATFDSAFAGRTGTLTRQSAADTFAVSFHLTRMSAYDARKADGNVELRTPVTGSIYFTNVVTGEILFTTTSTNAALALLPASALQGSGRQAEEDKLYASSLTALIAQLGKQAGTAFQPRRVDATVTGQQNGLLLLSTGYRQGVQSGDSLEDEQSNLIKVVYAGADYAVAQVVLADQIGAGASFHKFVVGPVDGRLRPRATVVADQVPTDFSAEYLTQLFSEELGAKAPLTMVQVNPTFSGLLTSVLQKADLSNSSTARRDTPDLIIRLRVGQPVQYETHTNLAFQTTRGVEVRAYAELIDTSGRVLFAAMGEDSQKTVVTRGLDLAPAARREIAVKNALLALAQKLGTLAEGQPDRASVVQASASAVSVATPAQVYAPKAPGFLLRPTRFTVGGKPVSLLFPLYEAVAEQRSGNDTTLGRLLPLGKERPAPAVGDVFEVLHLGTAPKSATAFSLCPDSENLGTVRTPEFDNLASHALAQVMPGQYYAADVRSAADALINVGNGFNAALDWNIPPTAICVQAVQRVDVSADECADTCRKAMTARYTLRVRNNNVVGAKFGLESKFKSNGYQASSPAADVERLIQLDVVDEAQKLLPGLAGKLVFPPPN
ncbi:MAG: hypothetical protein ACEQSK_00805 [Sphingomonadaceae bacterium]